MIRTKSFNLDKLEGDVIFNKSYSIINPVMCTFEIKRDRGTIALFVKCLVDDSLHAENDPY
jgi:hypothetical protein